MTKVQLCHYQYWHLSQLHEQNESYFIQQLNWNWCRRYPFKNCIKLKVDIRSPLSNGLVFNTVFVHWSLSNESVLHWQAFFEININIIWNHFINKLCCTIQSFQVSRFPGSEAANLDFAFFNPCSPICGQQFMLSEHIIHVILGCNPSYVHFTVNCECAVI